VSTRFYDGLIYEPRAFWDVKRVDAAVRPQSVFFDARNAFMNGERYPVEIREITLAPINYLAQTDVLPTSGGRYGGAACFSACKATIAVRLRQNYSRFALDLRGYSPSRTQPPSPSYYSDSKKDLRRASDLYGILYKKFERPFVLPEFGSVELALSSFSGGAPAPPEVPGLPPRFSATWWEAGGLLEGSGRTFGPRTLLSATTSAAAPYGAVITGTAGTAAGNSTTSATFPPQHVYTPRDFRAQRPTVQGSQRFLGLSLQIDQIDYDDSFIAAAAVYGPITPLSMRTGCRIRTADGGTKADWWRPGAPLALVMTHITPAQVYRLPQPLTLEPGDQLEVELELPGATPVAEQPTETYSIGIAFNGYAAIEG